MNTEHVAMNNKKKSRGKHQRHIPVSNPETEQDEYASNQIDHSEQGPGEPSLSKDNRKVKTYLQGFKIIAYLKARANNDKKIKSELKDTMNMVCTYAKNTIEAYDTWVQNHYDAQVWQHFYDLGREKDHWAKEIVNITHTREAKRNLDFCEKKISRFTSACLDANNIITRNMTDSSSDLSASVALKRTHDLMLDYIKEATQGLSKMSMNRIRRACVEQDEWNALKTFEEAASEQQKIYAKTFLKPVIKSYHRKKKNFDLVAAHISYDIVPKILPQYDFNLPVDDGSLSSEQAQENKVNIQKLSREFRLKATELYLKVTKEEFEFQEERLQNFLMSFLQIEMLYH